MVLIRWVLAVTLLLVTIAGVAAVAVAFTRPETFWQVDGSDLARSLEREGDGFSALECMPSAGNRWTCAVGRDLTSGVDGVYVLQLDDDDRCWRARRDGRGAPQPLAGCVSASDHVVPW